MTTTLTPAEGWLVSLQRPPAAWLADELGHLPVERVLCLSTGWGTEARALQRLGWSVATADTLESSAWRNRALVASDTVPVSERRLSDWLKLRKEPEVVKRFMAWSGRTFTPEETIWLGIWHRTMADPGLSDPERAIGYAAVYRTMHYWLSWNRLELGFKPLPPSAVLRAQVEAVNREVSGGSRASHGVARMAYEAALTKFPGDLLYCYVPPGEGIGSLDLATELCERWTQGDPEAPAGDRLEPLDRLVERAQAFPLVALGYSGDQGDRLEGLLARVRPILSRREFDVPNPPPGGHGPVRVGLLVAGQASGATHEERE